MDHPAPDPAGRNRDAPHRRGGTLSAPATPIGPAPEPDAAELERGRLLFAAEARFFHGSQRLDQLPEAGPPEIAFAGRSNVGKSSLINALTGHRALARASSEPGRTKQLNFFALGGHRLTLVDMPGYGFAKANREVKEDWQDTMFGFLRGRVTLRRVVLLLDARIEVKKNDEQAMELLDRAAVVFQLVLTKCDALKPAALAAKTAEATRLAARFAAAHPYPLATSSETGVGIPELRAALAALAEDGA